MKHGTLNGYQGHGCRCADCQAAERASRRDAPTHITAVPSDPVDVPDRKRGVSVLTDDEVRDIRKRMDDKPRPWGTALNLARKYRVHRDTIYAIASRESRGGVADDE